MSLMFEPLRKYASFSGRARRKEYWLWQILMFALFSVLVGWLFYSIGADSVANFPEDSAGMEAAITTAPGAMLPLAVMGIAGLLLFIPSVALTVRRLHDSGNSGWWILLSLTAVGGIILFIFAIIDGTLGPNRYGPDPKGRAAPDYR